MMDEPGHPHVGRSLHQEEIGVREVREQAIEGRENEVGSRNQPQQRVSPQPQTFPRGRIRLQGVDFILCDWLCGPQVTGVGRCLVPACRVVEETRRLAATLRTMPIVIN